MGYSHCFEHSHKALEMPMGLNVSFSKGSSDSPYLVYTLHSLVFANLVLGMLNPWEC